MNIPRQKPVLVKIDNDTFYELEQEVSLGYMKRNRIINEAIRMYIDAKDTRRRQRMAPSYIDKNKVLAQFTLRWFPHL